MMKCRLKLIKLMDMEAMVVEIAMDMDVTTSRRLCRWEWQSGKSAPGYDADLWNRVSQRLCYELGSGPFVEDVRDDVTEAVAPGTSSVTTILGRTVPHLLRAQLYGNDLTSRISHIWLDFPPKTSISEKNKINKVIYNRLHLLVISRKI